MRECWTVVAGPIGKIAHLAPCEDVPTSFRDAIVARLIKAVSCAFHAL